MIIFLVILICLLIIISILVISDKITIRRLVNELKIGSRCRIFTDNETTFYRVTIREIYTDKNGKRRAKCENERGEIEDYRLTDLIY